MAGVCEAGPSWLLLLLVTVLPPSPVNGNYVLDICYCYSDNYDATLLQKIESFTNPPTTQPYEYVGVMPKTGDVFDPCICSDVTRVSTVLKVTQSNIVTDAADSTKRADLNDLVTSKLNDLIASMKSASPSLDPTLLSFKAVYASSTSNEVLFDVEILLRGQNENLVDTVGSALKSELAGNTLPGVGDVDTSSMVFSAMKCDSNPPAALANGQRTWTNSNIASSKAVYTCDARYTLSSGNSEHTSTCSHSDLNWTALPDGLKCNPDIAECADNPPPAPPQSSSSWNNYSKEEATVVTYTCVDGYSSEDDIRAVSTCRSGTWTTIASSFKCIQTGCLEPPPQVPNQGVLTWGRQKADGTVVLYACNNGYKSNTGKNPEVHCTNQTWVGFPDNWACVDEKTKLNLGAESTTGSDDDDDDEINYFYIVTIPSVGGLILLIICCLCCTRTDSPLFNICSAKGKLDAGYSAA